MSTDSELDALALDVGRLEERITALERRQRAVDAYVEDLRTNGPRHRVFGRPPSPYEPPMLTELPRPPAALEGWR